jgi:hypothetical protein
MLGPMRSPLGRVAAILCCLAVLVVMGCGSSKSKSGEGGQSAADAKSAATGDIPDNQVFLTFRNQAAGYSILYPEGWARKGGGNRTTFQDKSNVIRIVVRRGGRPTVASARADIEKLKASTPSLTVGSAQTVMLQGQQVVKVSYSSESPPNPVTGRRVKLVIDRYVYFKGGRVAAVDLGTAVGVDNVDAYRMISRSFKWS